MTIVDQIRTLLLDNWRAVVVTLILTAIATFVWRVIARFFRAVRAYGLAEVAKAARDAFLHITAYQVIKGDPVLTASYLSKHLASLALNGVVCIVLAIASASSLHEPGWLRTLAILGCLLFAWRALRRWFGINAFYSITAGKAIEEVKKSNPILNKLYGVSKKKPLFSFGQPSAATSANTIEATAQPAEPTETNLALPGQPEKTANNGDAQS